MTIEIASGTNRSFSHQITTSALPQNIWQLWTNPSTWKNWDLEIKEANLKYPIANGVTGSLVPRSGFPTKFTINEYQRMQCYSFITKLPGATLTVKRSFVQIEPVVIFRHDVFFSGFLAWFWSFLLGKKFRQVLPPTMNRLEKLALEMS